MKLMTIENARKAALKISSNDKYIMRHQCEQIKEGILNMVDKLAKLESEGSTAAIDLNDYLTESDAFEDIKKFQQILG